MKGHEKLCPFIYYYTTSSVDLFLSQLHIDERDLGNRLSSGDSRNATMPPLLEYVFAVACLIKIGDCRAGK